MPREVPQRQCPAPAARRESAPRPGTTVVALEFVEAWENERNQPYHPFEGLAGCAYTEDGTLVVSLGQAGGVAANDAGSGPANGADGAGRLQG